MKAKDRKIAMTDLETSGDIPGEHEILEIGLVIVVYNRQEISRPLAEKYAQQEKAHPVLPGSLEPIWSENYLPADLVDEMGGIVRHHQRIASVIANL